MLYRLPDRNVIDPKAIQSMKILDKVLSSSNDIYYDRVVIVVGKKEDQFVIEVSGRETAEKLIDELFELANGESDYGKNC